MLSLIDLDEETAGILIDSAENTKWGRKTNILEDRNKIQVNQYAREMDSA